MDNDTAWRGVIRWYEGSDHPPTATTWEEVFGHFRAGLGSDIQRLSGEVIYRGCLLSKADFQVVQDPGVKIKEVRTGKEHKSVQSWTTSEKFAQGWAIDNNSPQQAASAGYVVCVVGAKFEPGAIMSSTEGFADVMDQAHYQTGVDPETFEEVLNMLEEYEHEQEVVVRLERANVIELSVPTGERNGNVYEYAPVKLASEADRRANQEYMQVVHDWYWGTYEGGVINSTQQARLVRAFGNLGITDNPSGEIYRACLLSHSDAEALRRAEKVRVRAAREGQQVQSWTTDEGFARAWTFGRLSGTKWVGVVLGARFPREEMLCNTEGLIDLLQDHLDGREGLQSRAFEGVSQDVLERLLGDLRAHFRGEHEVVVLQEGDTEVLDVEVVAQ